MNLGATTFKRNQELQNFISENKHNLEKNDISARNFEIIYDVLNLKSLASPGDSVGVIAGQSFGEPSTQMTLNTFHLAGHGGANVTLGIPRLRELLSTKNIKNPMMLLPIKKGRSEEEIKEFFKMKQGVSLLQLVRAVELEEELICFEKEDMVKGAMESASKMLLRPKDRYKRLVVRLEYEEEEAIIECFNINYKQTTEIVQNRFVALFTKVLRKLMKGSKTKTNRNQNTMKKLMDEIEKEEEEKPKSKKEKLKKKADEDLELVEEDNEAVLSKISKKKVLLNPEKENSLLHMTIFEENKLDLEFRVPLDLKRTLFIPIIEELLAKVTIGETQNIKKLYLIEDRNLVTLGTPQNYILQTEGITFPFVWSHANIFDVNRIQSNDVQEIARVYGIEAGRNSLAKEVNKVFSHYGIAVDFRHMSLVADHMSFSGELRPMSRMGIQHAQSPLLKMSFETSMNFLIQASENKDFDNLYSPSANIVVGELMKFVTGAFDVIDCQAGEAY